MIDLQDPISLLRLNQLDMNNQDDSAPQNDFVRNSIADTAMRANQNNPQDVRSPLEQFKPQTNAQDTFNALINNEPIMRPHGALHHIAAAIVGAGLGPDAAEKFSLGNHPQEMQDWMAKANLAQKSAQDENATNNINKTLAIEQGKDVDRDEKQRALEAKQQGDLEVANKKATTAATNAATWQKRAETQTIIANGGVPLFDEKTGQGFMVHRDGTKVPLDITHLTPEQKDEAKARYQKEVNAARPGASAAGTSIFQPVNQETGKPDAPIIVDRKTGTTKPIIGQDKQPINSGKVQAPNAQLQQQSLTFGKFINEPHINQQFAAVGHKPQDFFKIDPTSGMISGLKDRKDFTDPNDLKLYDYIYGYFNKGKK